MSASDPSPRRRVPVRLCDIPLEVRLRAARDVHARTEKERDELLLAAYEPSSDVFYVVDDAYSERHAA